MVVGFNANFLTYNNVAFIQGQLNQSLIKTYGFEVINSDDQKK